MANQSSGATGNLVVLATSGTAIQVQGSSHLTVAGTGDIMVNSTASNSIVTSPGSVTAGTIAVAGSTFPTCTCTGTQKTSVAPIADPLGDLAAPSAPASSGSCNAATHICTPGLYSSAINLSSGAWTFNSGFYYLQNGMTIANATATGSDLMFYNAGGGINIQNNSTTVTFTGLSTVPTGLTDDYKGLLIFQNRNNQNPMVVQSNATANLNGIVYITKAPGATWNYGSGGFAFLYNSGSSTAASGYTIFVLWNVNMQGGGTFTMNSNFGAGGNPLRHASIAE